jgi:hypothetical protein
VSSPNQTKDQNVLHAVSAAGSDDVWAVGSFGRLVSDYTESIPLIEHYDGHAWSIVHDGFGSTQGELTGVAAISPDDVWAVGWVWRFQAAKSVALFEHWDGSGWRAVKAPPLQISTDPGIRVAAVSSNDVWGLGWSYDSTGYHPAFYHWDGGTWSVVPSPRVQVGYHTRFGLAPVASDDVWAAVNRVARSGLAYLQLLHWDGTRWRRVASPRVQISYYANLAVSAASATDVWLVGERDDATGGPLSLHFDGSSWSIFRVLAGPGGELLGVSSTATGTLGVGERPVGVNDTEHTLVVATG